MTVIFRGRRYSAAGHEVRAGVRLELMIGGDPATLVLVAGGDTDLILSPTAEDLHLAEAFERGEISAFEYADGHTYPPNREIIRSPDHVTARRMH
jgi:hypothetical protein